jgi:pyroglutamyl-peptidase
MVRILLTAFEAYEPWSANASWLALAELLRELDTSLEITTRLYPVELATMKDKLATDMKSRYDYVFHLGQAPHSSCIQLEKVAINVATAGKSIEQTESACSVCESGPIAYRSELPLEGFAREMRDAGIPTRVSYHAGTFLCNAILFWSHQLISDLELPTKSAFVHIPLDTSQVLMLDEPTAFMPKAMVADGLKLMLNLVASEVAETV